MCNNLSKKVKEAALNVWAFHTRWDAAQQNPLSVKQANKQTPSWGQLNGRLLLDGFLSSFQFLLLSANWGPKWEKSNFFRSFTSVFALLGFCVHLAS